MIATIRIYVVTIVASLHTLIAAHPGDFEYSIAANQPHATIIPSVVIGELLIAIKRWLSSQHKVSDRLDELEAKLESQNLDRLDRIEAALDRLVENQANN